MKEQFFRVSVDKQRRIEFAALQEFSSCFYFEASLNRIISSSGVSKGGMFKYIESKKDLYLYLFDKYVSMLFEYQSENVDLSNTDFLARIRDIAYLSVKFYEKHKDVYKFILNALLDYSSEAYVEVCSIRNKYMAKYHSKFFDSINYENYSYSPSELLKIYGFLSAGVSQSITLNHSITDILAELDFMLTVLSKGVRR